MGEASLSKQLKGLVEDFTDDNGNILDKPKYKNIKTWIQGDRIEFLRQLVDLLLNSKWLKEETKIYIKDRYITKEGVYEKLKYAGKDVNLNTIRSNIHNDMKRIASAFGERFLVNVTEYMNFDITSYKQILADLRAKKSNVKILNNIALKLPPGDSTTSISQEEFDEFMSIIKPYTKRQMEFISNEISNSVVGYIKYILTSTLLNDVDKQRKEQLMMLLGDE